MSKIHIAAFISATLVFAYSAQAAETMYPKTVVELFTSQGCSSCPPANAFVREIATDDGELLALSFSVDYWDYLGWKDTFGKPGFSKRQRQYGERFQGQVYTPQLVVNGEIHGARIAERKIRAHALPAKMENVLKIDAGADSLTITVDAQTQPETLIDVIYARYTTGVSQVDVRRGENRGRAVSLANVVRKCGKLGRLDVGMEFSAQLDLPVNGEAVAVLLQEADGGPIWGAATYLP